jgi:hypothetical protein
MKLPALGRSSAGTSWKRSSNDPVADARQAAGLFEDEFRSFDGLRQTEPELFALLRFLLTTPAGQDDPLAKGLTLFFRALDQAWPPPSDDLPAPANAQGASLQRDIVAAGLRNESLLYVSPEQLRNKSFRSAIAGRKLADPDLKLSFLAARDDRCRGQVQVLRVTDGASQAQAVVAEIPRLRQLGVAEGSSIAVLSRQRAFQADRVVRDDCPVRSVWPAK